MASPILPRLRTVTLVVAATVSLSACNAVTRMAQIGTAPPITPIENPTEQPGYRVVSLPMPEPTHDRFMANSLWRQGARAFFKDQRAARVGDILTVVINISDKATFDNETERTRENTEDSDITNFLGLETQLEKKLLPESFDPTSALSLGSTSKSKGVGKVDRSEELNLTVAALVTQVLPNGNLVVQGRQEVRVNFEVRELLIAGVVRPEDITSSNTVQHTQIAEARISYGGRGQLTDVQQPRYGQQVMDILFPF
jgi:flagellar L-ring protein precursor FlgH